MIPCGIKAATGSVTSLAKELGRDCAMDKALHPLAESVLEILQLKALKMDALKTI